MHLPCSKLTSLALICTSISFAEANLPTADLNTCPTVAIHSLPPAPPWPGPFDDVPETSARMPDVELGVLASFNGSSLKFHYNSSFILLDARTGVTARHVVEGAHPNQFAVMVPPEETRDDDEWEIYPIRQFRFPNEFRQEAVRGDWVLVELAESIKRFEGKSIAPFPATPKTGETPLGYLLWNPQPTLHRSRYEIAVQLDSSGPGSPLSATPSAIFKYDWRGQSGTPAFHIDARQEYQWIGIQSEQIRSTSNGEIVELRIEPAQAIFEAYKTFRKRGHEETRSGSVPTGFNHYTRIEKFDATWEGDVVLSGGAPATDSARILAANFILKSIPNHSLKVEVSPLSGSEAEKNPPEFLVLTRDLKRDHGYTILRSHMENAIVPPNGSTHQIIQIRTRSLKPSKSDAVPFRIRFEWLSEDEENES